MSHDPLPIGSVPVFNCEVILGRDDGKVTAVVANLDGIEATAASEVEALKSVVTTFKARMASYNESGEEIPWIKPSRKAGPDEVTRLIPVHL